MSSFIGRGRRQYRQANNAATFQNAFGASTDAILAGIGAGVAGELNGTNDMNHQLMAAGRACILADTGTLEETQGSSDDDSDAYPSAARPPAAARGSSAAANAPGRGGARNTSTTNSNAARVQDPAVRQAYVMLQSRNKAIGQVKSSTEKKINPVHQYWKNFCEANHVQDPNEYLHFLDDNKEHDMVKMRSFIQFCDGREPPLTYSQMDNAVLFVQYYLNRECSANDKPQIKGAVKSDPAIKTVLEKYQRSKATRALENNEDIQSKIARRISEEEMLELVSQAFCPTTPATQRLHPLTRIQTVTSIRHTHQTGQRGDDLRSFTFSMAFQRSVRQVGPGGGTELDYIVTKQGKTNKVGKQEYSALAPHINPMLDTCGWQGLGYMYRFIILGEQVPDFTKWVEYFHLPVYRSITSANAFLDGSVQNTQWNALYAAVGIIVNKVTHQGRVQAQQDMDNNGVSNPHIARICQYQDGSCNGNQQRSYLDNPPLDAVVERAGGNPRDIQRFNPVWDKVPVSRALLSLAIPELPLMVDAVDEKYGDATTRKELEEQRLFTAKGAVHAFKGRIVRGLQVAASRPLDANGKLCVNSLPLYLKYRDTFALFRHTLFYSAEFAQLAAAMKAAQDDASANKIVVNEACANEIERQLNTTVMPALQSNQGDLRLVTRKMEDLQSSQGSHADRVEEALSRMDQRQVIFFREMWNLQHSRNPVYLDEAARDARFDQLMLISPAAARASAPPLQLPGLPRPAADVAPAASDGANNSDVGYKADGVTVRKRKAIVLREKDFGAGNGQKRVLMSTENVTLEDYWNEFSRGRNGQPSLRQLEEQGMEWRRDPKGSSRFRTFWYYRAPIYNLVTHYMSRGVSEKDALAMTQVMFNLVPKSRSGKPKQHLIPTTFNNKLKALGGYASRKYQ